MEQSHESECSKTSPSKPSEDYESNKANDEFEDESNYKPSNNNNSNGGSSSNSTVEESEKKPSVRPYVRSKLPRLRWTPDLHLRFVHAVQRLGGQDRATPKLVLQMMDIKGLSIAHVKSHLQMYRSKKVDDPNQVLANNRQLMESGDRNIYNLSQLPMLQGYNQSQGSSRYGYSDAPWNAYERMMHKPFMKRTSTLDYETRSAGFYNSTTERIFGSNYTNWISSNWNFLEGGTSSFGQQSSRKAQDDQTKDDRFLSFHTKSPQELTTSFNDAANPPNAITNSTSNPQEQKIRLKRKASECELDLDLCLGFNPKNVREGSGKCLEGHEVVDSSLSLSLYSQSSSSNVSSWLKEGEKKCKEQAKRASTLDLTL